MKSINEIIFIDSLNKLDLHGYDRATAHLMIEDFIKENIILKNEFVVIVHGIGTGIIKNETINVLKNNKLVKDYKICPYNVGCTIVQINLTK